MTAELTPDNNGRAEIVLLYPNRTRLTITGDYEVVRQIVQRLDGLEIIYRVDDTPGDHEHDFRCTQCGVECRGDIQAEIKRQVLEVLERQLQNARDELSHEKSYLNNQKNIDYYSNVINFIKNSHQYKQLTAALQQEQKTLSPANQPGTEEENHNAS